MNTATLADLDSIYDPELNKVQTYKNGDFVIIYQPVIEETEQGTITAQLIIAGDGETEISKYFSRGWAFWNYIDHLPDPDFTIANEAMDTESYLLHHRGEPDTRIIFVEQIVDTIKNGGTPHTNPEWQKLVVSMAYNALTESSDFIQFAKQAGLKPFDVQLMIDRAMFQILGHPNFALNGFETATI